MAISPFPFTSLQEALHAKPSSELESAKPQRPNLHLSSSSIVSSNGIYHHDSTLPTPSIIMEAGGPYIASSNTTRLPPSTLPALPPPRSHNPRPSFPPTLSHPPIHSCPSSPALSMRSTNTPRRGRARILDNANLSAGPPLRHPQVRTTAQRRGLLGRAIKGDDAGAIGCD